MVALSFIYSILELMKLFRMFTDALDKVNYNLSKGSDCLLGSSKLEVSVIWVDECDLLFIL